MKMGNILFFYLLTGVIAALLWNSDLDTDTFSCGKLAVKSRKRKSTYPIVALVLFVLTACTREIAPNNIGGTDAYVYEQIYSFANRSFWEYWPSLSFTEVGASLFNWILFQVGVDYRIVLCIKNIILFEALVYLYRNIHWERNFCGKVSFFLLVSQLFMGFNIERNIIAIYIVLNSIKQLINGKYRRCFALIILAGLIHITVFILIIPTLFIFLIKYVKQKRDMMLILCIGSAFFISIVLLGGLLNFDKMGKYAGYVKNHGYLSISLIIFVIFSNIVILVYWKLQLDKMWLLYWLSSFILIPVCLLMYNSDRFILLYYPIFFYLAPKVIRQIQTKYMFCSSIIWLMLIYRFINLPNVWGYSMSTYKCIFF